MQIVANHFKPGRVVEKYSQIAEIVEELIPFVDGGIKRGEYNDAFAIAHPQVSEDPWAFFVVNSKFVGKGKDLWPASAIINPKILEADDKVTVGELPDGRPDVRKNIRVYSEGCFSFPMRKPKNVRRYFRITVEYQIKAWYGLKTIREEIEGLRAHIFQHEFMHTVGENIYFPKP